MFYGWRVLAALCVVYFVSVGVGFYAFAVVLPSMILDLGWSRGGASVGHAILALTFGGGAVAAALVLGRVGARNTIVLGGVLSALGSMVIYFCDALDQFYVGIGVFGFGISLQSLVPGTQLLTNWFVQRRAISMGLFLSMGGLGAFVAAPSVAYVMEATGDWRVAWLITAVCALVGSLVAFALVRNYPADVGTTPDGVDPGELESLSVGGAADAASRVYRTRVQWGTGEAYRTYAMWVVIFAAGMAGVGLALNASQSVIHLLDNGINPVIAGSAVGFVGLLSTGGRLFAGAVGDRIDPRVILGLGLAVEILGVILLTYTDTTTLVYVYSVLFGAGNGATVVAIPALVANYFGAQSYAKIYGALQLILTPLAAAASVLAGVVYDNTQSYREVFLGYSVLAFVPVLMIMVMRNPRHANEPVREAIGQK